MDRSSMQTAASVQDSSAPDSNSTKTKDAAHTICVPAEIVMHVLKLSIASKPPNHSETRRALCAYSLLSKAYQPWAQTTLFKWLSVDQEEQILEVGDVRYSRHDLAEAVQTLELGAECWERYTSGPGSIQDEISKTCPAYKKGELTLKLTWVQLNFDSVHDFPLLQCLILEQVETHLDSGDDLSAGAHRKAPFVNLTTLELISFDDFYNQNPFEAALFPALQTIVDHRRLEPLAVGGAVHFEPYSPALAQLTALYLNHLDEYSLPALWKCTNLLLLDLPLEPFAAGLCRAGNENPSATRVLTKWPHRILPPELRFLRLHHVASNPKYDFRLDEIEEGLDEVETIVSARLQKGSGGDRKAKLEMLVVPRDAAWNSMIKLAKEKGCEVTLQSAEMDPEENVAVFKELQRELVLA